MAYTPLQYANQIDIHRMEKRFLIFCTIYWGIITLTTIYSVIFWSEAKSFWLGNILWIFGSFLVFFSVLHNRYFDIKKNSNPNNYHLDTKSFDKTIKFIEKIANHTWVAGFLLIAVSRWIKF